MANELYLITKDEDNLRIVACAKSERYLRHTYPWCTSDARIRCIGIALPGELARTICVSTQDGQGEPNED